MSFAREKIKVLIADDHRLFREGLKRLLESEHDLECVAMAGNGLEAIKLAVEFIPDVALIDIAMPEMNGIEVATKIKSNCPATAVIILSAYKHQGYVIACMKAGVDGYLLKDMSPEELTNAVRAVYAQESVYSKVATRKILSKLIDSYTDRKRQPTVLQGRELEVLGLVVKGMTNKKIASQIGLSEHTVRTHVSHILAKFGVSSRTEAVSYAMKEGLITTDELPSDEPIAPD